MPDFLMKTNTKYFLAIVSLVSVFWINTLHAETTLAFGVYTSDKPSTMVKKFRPILNVMERKLTVELGTPVKMKMKVAKSYEEGIEDIVNGRVDISRLGPASYVEVKKQNPDISILAIESKNGQKRFNGVICIRDDSGIKTIADLKGKRFAFGNQRSTIGRYLSQQHLAKNGIKASDLANFEYLDRHDKVGEAVAQGKFDAGALKQGTFKKLVKKGRKLKELATFINVTKPWVASSKVPDKIKKSITKVLVTLKDPIALKSLKKTGFLEGSDTDYEMIRNSINNNKRFFE